MLKKGYKKHLLLKLSKVGYITVVYLLYRVRKTLNNTFAISITKGCHQYCVDG